MDILFDLKFYDHCEELLPAVNFTTSDAELLINEKDYTVNVKENHNLSLQFQSNYKVKLFIDILDVLPEYCYTEEELNETKKACFLPSAEKRYLYMNSNADTNEFKIEYPVLIPGSYKIRIEDSEVNYYAFLKVNPLRVDNDQLKKMKEEIDSYIIGLSKEFSRNVNVDVKGLSNSDLLFKTNLFMDYSTKVINSINTIIKDPRYEIKKEYKLSELSKSGRIDFKTIRHKQRRMDIHDKLLTYYNTIEYNITENKLIKKIVNILNKEIRICIDFLEKHNTRNDIQLDEELEFGRKGNSQFKSREYLKSNIKVLKSQSNLFQKFLNSDWMELVEEAYDIKKPRKLVRYPEYNMIYSLFLQLKNQKKINIDPLRNYSYFWKESSKLYEIWGFLKIIEIIKTCKFNLKPIDGWIYSSNNQLIHDVLPFLDSETKITFVNTDGLKLNLYYDSQLLKAENCSKENPVFTVERQNRPDFRIDIYKDSFYYRTIIGDLKYRPYASLNTIKTYGTNPQASTVYKQLLSYSRISSSYIRSENEKSRSESAAYETWVFYPSELHVKHIRRRDWDRETNIRRLELSPIKDFKDIENHFERVLDEIV